MSRYLSAYRWELWLIVGIPAIAFVVGNVAHVGVTALFVVSDSYSDLALAANRAVLPASIGGVKLLLLAVSYPRVRGLGRDFLSLLWGYLMVVSLIWLIASGGFFLAWADYAEVNPGVVLGRSIAVATIASVPHYLALLWFARRASRISLTHAFFLVAFTMFVVVRPWADPETEWGIMAVYGPMLVGAIATLVVMLLKVWLLGNFDDRGPGFRRNAIAGVIAATVAAGFIALLLVSLLGYAEGQLSVASLLLNSWSGSFFFSTSVITMLLEFGVMLALVYLVRVRQPRAEAHQVGNSLQ